MRTAFVRGLMLAAAFAFITSAVVAQEPGAKISDESQCAGCVSRVLQLQGSPSPVEMQDVTNMFRTVVEISFIHQDVSQHTISITGTPEQVDTAEKLIAALENLRSSGGGATSVLVHESQVPQSQLGIRSDRDLATSYIKVLYRPNISMRQMQALTNSLRTTLQILRMQQMPSSHVIVVRGTAEQVARAENVVVE